MTLTIRFYAGLRDFFGSEITLESENTALTASVLRAKLIALQPNAADLIAISAVALGTKILSDSAKLLSSELTNQKISLLPPAGGG